MCNEQFIKKIFMELEHDEHPYIQTICLVDVFFKDFSEWADKKISFRLFINL